MKSAEEFTRLIQKAERTNRWRDRQRDRVDLEAGFTSPPGLDPAGLLRNAMSAILCGIRVEDWDNIAEGYVMLYQLHYRMTNKEYRPDKKML